jgi:phospholipase C
VGLYDHTSVLKIIEWRCNVAPLTSRDASDEIGNLASALNFVNPNFTPPQLPVVRAPFPTPCGLFELGSQIDNESYDFLKLFNSNNMTGWRKP